MSASSFAAVSPASRWPLLVLIALAIALPASAHVPRVSQLDAIDATREFTAAPPIDDGSIDFEPIQLYDAPTSFAIFTAAVQRGGTAQQHLMHARYYAPFAGRFLSVDPIMSAVPANPQSWNRYAYALNNPLKFTDPTGMYVFGGCTGDQKQCQADQDAFEKARQEQLKSSDESVRNAAAAYGDLGDKNGVTVGFATGKDLGAFNGDTTAQLVRGEQVSATYDVRIMTGMRGSDLGNATVHEGEHVRNAQTYVGALQRGVFDPSLNLRLYQTEMNAYMVSWSFARTNNLTLRYNGMTLKGAMPREQLRQEIDRFLRRDPYKLTPETLRCQISPCG